MKDQTQARLSITGLKVTNGDKSFSLDNMEIESHFDIEFSESEHGKVMDFASSLCNMLIGFSSTALDKISKVDELSREARRNLSAQEHKQRLEEMRVADEIERAKHERIHSTKRP